MFRSSVREQFDTPNAKALRGSNVAGAIQNAVESYRIKRRDVVLPFTLEFHASRFVGIVEQVKNLQARVLVQEEDVVCRCVIFR